MSQYTYPASDLDRPDKLAALLGSHWSEFYGGVATTEALVAADAILDQQAIQDANEAFDCVSRRTVPVHHVERYLPLTLVESDRNSDKTALLAYGTAGEVYGGGVHKLRSYGDVAIQDGLYSFPISPAIRQITGVADRVIDPNVVWIENADYYLDKTRSSIVFLTDPFNDSRWSPTQRFSGGELSDRELTVVLLNASLDWEYLYRHFGYIAKLKGASSEEYKQLLNAVLDAHVRGTAEGDVRRAISAATGIPCMNSRGVVEGVETGSNGTWLVTESEAYHYSGESQLTVSAGDSIRPRQFVSDDVQVYDLGKGVTPDGLPGIVIGPDLINSGIIKGELFFKNEPVPVTVSEYQGRTRLEFPLEGSDRDVEAFWAEVHRRGVMSGETIANSLDVRSDPPNEPSAASLPATINPCEFLIANLIGANTLLVWIKSSRLPKQKAGLYSLHRLRDIIPPGSHLLIHVEMDAGTRQVIMEGPGNTVYPGYEADSELGLAFNTKSATVHGPSLVAASVTLSSEITCD